MQTAVHKVINQGYQAARNGNWAAEAKEPKKWLHWAPIAPKDHPNQKLLVVDQTQYVVTRMICKRGWGFTRFKIIASSAAEAGKIAALYCGAIYADKPDPDEMALIRQAKEARL